MAGYIGTTPVPQATQHRESFTATGGQTSFATAGYTPQFIDVYLNGVKLAPADYTATNGSDVVLATGATASDILEIVAYTPFEVANQTFTGDTSVTNLAVTGTFTSRGIDDNADAVAITIDSSENVGIGTSSPSVPLHINTSGTSMARFVGGNDGNLYITNDSANVVTLQAAGGDALSFNTNGGNERMRIDSSGNVLVGKTSAGIGNVGFEFNPNGYMFATRSGGYTANFNRQTSDGDIVVFNKDGTTVGSIVTSSGLVGLNNGNTALTVDDSTNSIHTRLTNGTLRDGSTSLGKSDSRFNDLYLSGGVYLGGTGASNHLDDYEDGTFTITAQPSTSGSITISGTQNTGSYTKIGRQVTLTFKTEVASTSSPVGFFQINLPFTAASLSEQADNYHGTAALQNVPYTGDYVIAQITGGGSSIMSFLNVVAGGNWGAIDASLFGSGDDIRVTITYFTT